jgi:urease accessory protein
VKAAARIVAESDGGGRTRLAVLGGEAPLLPRRTGTWASTGMAVLGGATAVGSLLVVDPAWAAPGAKPAAGRSPGADASVARMPLAGPAVLTSAVAPDAHALRKSLTAPG